MNFSREWDQRYIENTHMLRHLRWLFRRFELLLLEERRVHAHIPASAGEFAAWNLVARKAHD